MYVIMYCVELSTTSVWNIPINMCTCCRCVCAHQKRLVFVVSALHVYTL